MPLHSNDDLELRLFGGCEVRAEDKGGTRRFEGKVVPWDRWDLIGGLFEERYQRNCFRRSITENPNAIPLLVGHKHDELPIGRALAFDDREDGLYGVWQLSDTEKAAETWTTIRDGSLSGLSVGFGTLPKQDLWEHREPPAFPRVTRRNCILKEVSVTPLPALAGSVITNTRTAYGDPATTPYLDQWKKYAATLKR